MKIGRKVILYVVAVIVFGLTLGVTYAAFTDKSKFTGSTFSVGSADIKLLNNVALGIDPSNLVEEKSGPGFENIEPYWFADYYVKIYNNATTNLLITTNANYETANDPAELRQVIYVEPFLWNDLNGDGDPEENEEGPSLGRKTIVKWKTEGFDLGEVNRGEVRGLILRFSTDAISDLKQGSSAIFDFEFNAVGT